MGNNSQLRIFAILFSEVAFVARPQVFCSRNISIFDSVYIIILFLVSVKSGNSLVILVFSLYCLGHGKK